MLLLIYLQLIEPFYLHKQTLVSTIASSKEDLQWMVAARDEVKSHQAKNGTQANRYKGSLLSTLDQSIRKNGLNESMDRIQPDGERVQIWFKNAGFDQLILWIGKITQQYGIEVDTVVIEQGNSTGRVDARLVVGNRS
jgi:general secretion pathway protein M